MRLWNKTTSEQWAISDSALNNILSIAEKENATPEAVAAKLGKQLENTYTVIERDGVAVLPVTGPLFRYTNFYTLFFGASSYERIALDFNAALDNPDIKSIIFDFDSPGGEVNGCAELASMIYEARGKKPIVGYASGDCASGAYWIASACEEIHVSETAALGSIGVVAVYRNTKGDTKNIEIVSSQSPNKRLDPTNDKAREKIQTRIDALANVFINSVSKHRNISPETVKEEYGQGDVFIGQEAVKRGLADSGGTLEQLINQLSQSNEDPHPAGFFSSKENTLMNLEELEAAHPDLCKQLVSKGEKEGIEKERKRISAVLDSDDAKGRGALAQHLAFNTDLTPEAIGTALKAVPAKAETSTPEKKTPEKVSGFDDVMASIANPDIEAGSENEDGEEETGEQIAARIAGYSNKKVKESV